MFKTTRLLGILILLVVGAVAAELHAHHQPTAATGLPVATTGHSYASIDQNSTTGAVPESSSATCHMRGLLPDPVCTPGSINPAVTDSNVASTICVRGYTATIRPAASYTNKLKRQQMYDYGFSDTLRNHEEDHLISLELGGAPADPANLWPEPQASPNPKDSVENFLHAAVCAGRISLSEAQKRIATDWTTAETGLTNN